MMLFVLLKVEETLPETSTLQVLHWCYQTKIYILTEAAVGEGVLNYINGRRRNNIASS